MEENDIRKEPSVLVVDDIAKNLQLVGSVLVENNIKPYFSTSGKQALKFLENTIPDLILLDISMPEMDGYELCEIIKSNPNTVNIPIIFLTARTQYEEVIRGFELGAVDYVTKPFNKGELLQRVSTHIKLKQALETIGKQKDELQQLNNAKDKMFSIIGHDLKGPVGNFRAITEILLKKQDDESTLNTLLNLLHISATNTYSLLDNLLNWALSQRNSLKMNKVDFDISTLISQNIKFLELEAQKKEINLVYENMQSIPVFADSGMISTILRNLIANAIKFTNNKGEIKVFTQVVDTFVQVTVQDNGIGISPENIAKIIDPYSIISTHGTDSEEGSGLGTKICIEFVKKNNGAFWIESEKGKGSKFNFTIPIVTF